MGELPRVRGVAVGLVLALLGCQAFKVPSADDAAVAVTNTGPDATQDLAVLVAPTPYAAFLLAFFRGWYGAHAINNVNIEIKAH